MKTLKISLVFGLCAAATAAFAQEETAPSFTFTQPAPAAEETAEDTQPQTPPLSDSLEPSFDLSLPDPTQNTSDEAQGGLSNIAVLRGLEKVTGRVREIELRINEPVRFGRLEITARACHQRPPEETPETTIFLEIDDHNLDGSVDRIFSGWMFASSPALNPLEHPVYDVWAMSCKASEPVEEDGSL